MARTLASAWVNISPAGFKEFAAKTQTGIKKVLKSVDATVPVDADVKPATLSIDGLKTRLAELSKTVTEARVGVDDKDAAAKLAKLDVSLDRLNRKITSPRITLEGMKAAEADLLTLDAQLDRLNGRKVTVDVKVKRSLLNRAAGDLFGLGGGGGGAAGGGAPAAGGAAGLGPLGLGAAAIPAAVFGGSVIGTTAVAATGIGALGLLAIPTLKKISTGIQQIQADTNAYDRATTKAAKNTALQHLKTDWANLSPGEAEAVRGVQKLGGAFDKLAAKLQPDILKIFNAGLKIANDLLPSVLPLAQAAAGPVEQLLAQFDRFAKSPGFHQFINALAKEIPGAIKTVGGGLAVIGPAIGKLLLVLGSPDAQRIAKGVFTAIGIAINIVTAIMAHAIPTWLENVHGIAVAFDHVRRAIAVFGHDVATTFDTIRRNVSNAWHVLMNDLAKSFDIFKNVVGIAWDDIKLSFLTGVKFILDVMGKLPGPLGAPFRKAAIDIGNSMTGIRNDVKRRTGQIQADINSIHGKNIVINETGVGRWSVSGPTSKTGVAHGPQNIGAGSAARGMFVRNGAGPTADDQLIWASKGELIVPTRLVAGGAVDHLRGMIPGFAGGGLVPSYSGTATGLGPWAKHNAGSTAQPMANLIGQQMLTAMLAAIKTAKAAQANPFAGITGVPSGGAIGAGAAAAQAYAKSILWAYGWGQNQFPPLQALWNGESGWRWNALNPGSGAYGIPQSLPASKMASAGSDWRTNPATQIRWGLGYIKAVYGTPGNTYATWLGRSPHWYASGGLVGQQGQTYLNAWRSRHGGGFGAAHGPVVLNEQIAEMKAAIGRATTLSHASGLSAGQHRFWGSAAADEKRRLTVLNKELTTERAWRSQLTGTDATLARDIAAAGHTPGLAKNVKSWKAQMAAHKFTIGQISGMLGYSNAYLAAHPPAPVLPGVKHTFGGDVGDTIAAYLASVISPLGLARGGQVKSYDQGGYLAPGLNLAYNGTGRPEPVGAPAVNITFEVSSSGNEFDAFMVAWMKKNVVVRGGGDTQVAFGQPNIKFVRR